jgi:glycerol-3-phosphate dehydrogenase subunit C
MCFLTKCPYVPPHTFDIDIPHLILRYRAAKRRAGEKQFVREELGETDRNGKLAKRVAGLANWATARKNTPLRKLLEAIAQIDAEAELAAIDRARLRRAEHAGVKSIPVEAGIGHRQRVIVRRRHSEQIGRVRGDRGGGDERRGSDLSEQAHPVLLQTNSD